ncbi:hypothetical protein HU200_000196 [Digitaria exilis]|uniref:PIR2-like helical domain-containing protein n=1 Tax=Digitaria exilis TaxID=1010633 RepID=A0A835G0P0_9POAL|nr:hypothetical protein HU200_000196 [Digitaria exilis]
MDGRRRRVGSPDLSYGDSVGIARNRSVILRTIHGYYKEALDALPLEDMPELSPWLLDAGVCFGFADPVTNIVANTLCFLSENYGEADHEGATADILRLLPDKNGEPEPDGTKKRKWKAKEAAMSREEVLSKIGAGNTPSSQSQEARTIAERSLDGLVMFLTSYFCYLPSWDALRYLCLAKADLLVAVRLIEIDRCYDKEDGFCIGSYAAKTALKYAALSARQPNASDFYSISLASRLKLITQAVLADQLSAEKIRWLSRMLKKTTYKLEDLDNPMLVADERVHSCCHSNAIGEKVPGGLTISLRSVLLDRIHSHYLKAISHIPTQDVRFCYHRGLVNAGFCYGPLDPVANIIVNTIWYDTTFPALENLEVDMICTSTFVRVESRSLSGLINHLLTCIPEISEHEAMVYLLKNNLEVKRAIQMARSEGCDISDSDITAYKVAAIGSFHPEVEAYIVFVTQHLPSVQSTVKSLLKLPNTLSSSDVHQISTLLCPSNCNPAKPLKANLEMVDELSSDALEMFGWFKEDFIFQQNFLRKKIETALKNKVLSFMFFLVCCDELGLPLFSLLYIATIFVPS